MLHEARRGLSPGRNMDLSYKYGDGAIKSKRSILIPKSTASSTWIGTRWVLNVKSDFSFKARKVRQGWSQRPGIDCGAVFAPVCRIESMPILLAIATRFHWDVTMCRRTKCIFTVVTHRGVITVVVQARKVATK